MVRVPVEVPVSGEGEGAGAHLGDVCRAESVERVGVDRSREGGAGVVQTEGQGTGGAAVVRDRARAGELADRFVKVVQV